MKISLSEVEEALKDTEGIEAIPSGFVYISGYWYCVDLLFEKILNSQQDEAISKSADEALYFFSNLGFKTVRIRPEPFGEEYPTPEKSTVMSNQSATIRGKTIHRSQVEQLLQRLSQNNLPFSIRNYYVECVAENGNVVRIPPKEIIAQITGLKKSTDFVTSEAIRVIERLGFQVKEIP